MENEIDRVFKQVNEGKSLRQKYPSINMMDEKTHVLYIHCLLNGSGFYRMFLPCRELNKTNTHSAVLGTIHKWDFAKPFIEYDNSIHLDLIRWADYIVLPAISEDFLSFYQLLKDCNADLKVAFDFDKLDLSNNTNENKKECRITNLQYADLVSCSTASIADEIEKAVIDSGISFKADFAIVPDLISQDSFIKLPSRGEKNNGKLRVGIVGTPMIGYDFEDLADSIVRPLKQAREKTELVLFGWDGKLKRKPVFRGIDIERHKAVRIQDYYQQVHKLNLDLALVPKSVQSGKAFGKSGIKYVELSALGIPVITDHDSHISRLISDQENGFIMHSKSDWSKFLQKAIKKEINYKEVGHYAQKFVWKNLSWNRFKAKLLANTYI